MSNCIPGNSAGMREVLERLLRFLQWMYAQEGRSADVGRDRLSDEIDVAVSALSMPARNCDVGTPEEQVRRFDAFCAVHHFQSENCCSGCPCHGGGICEFKWGQLPYGGKDESNE